MLVALAVALPFMLLTAGTIWRLAENERENRREAILYSTRALVSAVDALLGKQITIAKMLAAAPSLQAEDLVEFRKEAERTQPGLSGGWIVLADENGQQLMNLARPQSDALPERNPASVILQRRALQTGEVQISDVIIGRFVQAPVITIEVPVVRPGKRPLGLAVIMDSSAFKDLLDERNLPEGWLAGLIDRNGNFIARSRDHERTVGRPASEGFRAAARRSSEGWNTTMTLENESMTTGHATSQLSGWVMGLATGQNVFEAPIRRTILLAGLAGGGATLLSILVAVWAARRIAAPIEQIEQGTHALLRRDPIAFAKTGVPEVDRALDAFVATADTLEQHEKDRDEREAHVRLDHARAVAPLQESARHRAGDRAADGAHHQQLRGVRAALQCAHPGAGRRTRPAGRTAMDRRCAGRSGARATLRVRHGSGKH